MDNIVENIPNNFVYIVIIASIFYIFTQVIQARTSHIFSLIVTFFIIKTLREKSTTEYENFNTDIDYRYELIGLPSNFYMDVNLINLYFSIYKWKNFNPHNYNESIRAVNNVLQIEKHSQKLSRCVDNYEIAYDQSKNALNMLHGFIYNIEQPQLVAKLKKVLHRLQELLARHLSNIRKNCDTIEKNKPKINVDSRFVQDHDGPKAHDQYSQFDFY